VEGLIRTIDPDILLVQELLSSGPDMNTGRYTKRGATEHVLRQLAAATGLHCVIDGIPAFALGRGRRHVGLLYRDGIKPVPGELMRCDGLDYNIENGLVAAVFDVGGGTELRAGSAHMPVRDPGPSGWHEAGVVLFAFNRPIAGIVGGDWQSIGADPDYDHDPYDGVPWDPAFAYQLDRDGKSTRDIAIRLERIGRFRDCARLAGMPWTATTGHHPTDPHRIAPRRVDRLYATYHCPNPAIVGFEVTDLTALGNCSGHVPVSVVIDETALPA
jgi:endonuclease/exonuclease/phosphatase family metal-dependent hydrolase